MTTRDKIIEKYEELEMRYEALIKIQVTFGIVGDAMDVREKISNLQSELSALKSQLSKEPEMYPEEFVRWTITDLIKIKGYWRHMHETGMTVAELYNHWKDNIKDK